MSNSETTIDTGRRKQARSNATRAMGKTAASAAGSSKDSGTKPSARARQAPAAAVPGNRAASGQDGTVHWQRMVAEAAYFRAEQRGFVGGSPEQDWFEAEVELRRAHDNTGARKEDSKGSVDGAEVM
jgi:hypothetical protein